MTHCYAAWNRNREVLSQSTSGGVFSSLAELVFADGGIVVGATYGEGLKVEYYVAHNSVELAVLRGVKYVFSDLGRSVQTEMADALAKGRRVMFVGVPCQAAAIRKRFGLLKNLLVCDLVCFGAPPGSLWLKYVAWQEKRAGRRLKSISPRDKARGWGRVTYYRYEWEDGRVTRRCSRYDPYARAFYTTLGFRECCFKCQFRGMERVSDLTLCDMWNAKALNLPEDVICGGVSGVMVHTERGASAFARANVERLEVPLLTFLDGNFPIIKSPEKPLQWDEFNAYAKRHSFGELVRQYGLQQTRMGYVCQQVLGRVRRCVIACSPKRVLEVARKVCYHG